MGLWFEVRAALWDGKVEGRVLVVDKLAALKDWMEVGALVVGTLNYLLMINSSSS